MNLINDFFDGVFCLNIDERTDRWEESKKQFEKHNLNVIRYPAIKGSKLNSPILGQDVNYYIAGGVGGNLSFMSMIKTAKILGWKNFLVFEDDVALHNNLNELWDKIQPQIPENWDLIYFGGNHWFWPSDYEKILPEKYNENIYRVYNTVCLHAIGINHTMYDRIIQETHRIERPTDVNIGELQRSCMAIVTRPHLAWQRPSHSDVLQGYVDYSFLEHFENCKPIECVI